jgi:hypothetical protein
MSRSQNAWRLGVFGAALVFATVSFRWESDQLLPWRVRALGILAVAVGTALWAFVRRRVGPATKLADFADRHVRVILGVLAALSFVITATFAFRVLGPFPHIPDGFSYYFQAKIFAAGRLFAPAPALPQFFDYEWVMVHDGRWFSIFPPGWPMLLAAGVRVGVPALVNPILGSASVVAIYALDSALYGRRHGLLCATLCCLSPFFLFMSAEFMSHTSTLFATTLSTLCYVTAIGTAGKMWQFGAAGGCAAIALLIRPIDAVAIWGGQIAYGLWTAPSRRTLVGSSISAAVLACGVAVYVLYNHAIVGAWFVAPLALLSPHNRMGFGRDIGEPWTPFVTPGHDPWRALLNLNHNAAVMSQDLFGWPVSSLLFVVVLAVFGKTDRRYGLSFAVIAATVAGYALYWYHGVAFGARFYFALLPHFVMLTIEGIRQAPELMSHLLRRTSVSPVLRQIPVAVVTLCFAFGWAVYVPKVSFVAPYRNQREMNGEFYEFQRHQVPENALVFVRAPRVFYYGPAFIANQIPLERGAAIYALDRGGANRRVMALFPDRTVQYYTYRRERNTPPSWLPAFIRYAGPSH